MAVARPCVRISSTAFAASSIMVAATSSSAFFMGRRTYAAKSPTGWSGPTPSRTRANSSVPRALTTDFAPLCVPGLPRSRMRIVPQGRSRSSQTTSRPAGPSSYFSSSSRTATPLRFMNVCGLAKSTSCPASRPRPTSALASGRSTRIEPRFASSSTARNPRLCGVHWYSGPGFPSPTISHILVPFQPIQPITRCPNLPAASSPRRKKLASKSWNGTRPRLARLLALFALFALFAFLGFLLSLGALFALLFFLALLDDFGLGRDRRGFRSHGLDGLLLLDAQRDDVRDHSVRVREELHLRRVDGQVGGAQVLADEQVADVHAKFRRDFGRQAFDFDFTRDRLEDASLLLHARRFAEGMHRHPDAHAHVHGHAEQIDMQERPAERIHLPVFQNGRLPLGPELHLKERIVAGFGAQNRRHLLGVHRYRERFALAAIQHRRNLAGAAQAARFIFAPVRPGRCFNDNFSHTFFPSVRSRPDSPGLKL